MSSLQDLSLFNTYVIKKGGDISLAGHIPTGFTALWRMYMTEIDEDKLTDQIQEELETIDTKIDKQKIKIHS
jgi:uncharacterized membrane protein